MKGKVKFLVSCSWRFIPTRNFPETREKPINGCERAEICVLLRQKHNIFFIPTRKPETHEKAILIASEPKLLVFCGVKSDQKSETSEKNPEMIASEPKCSYFRVGFFFYHRPENQKIKKKLYILIASEPKFLVFLGLKHDSPQYFDKSHGLSVQ